MGVLNSIQFEEHVTSRLNPRNADIKKFLMSISKSQKNQLIASWNLVWPQPVFRLPEVGESNESYQLAMNQARIAYEDWETYNCWMTCVKKDWVDIPYTGKNFPPSNVQLYAPGNRGLIIHFMEGDLGPTIRKSPEPESHEKAWTAKWFYTDYNWWFKSPRFWSQMEHFETIWNGWFVPKLNRLNYVEIDVRIPFGQSEKSMNPSVLYSSRWPSAYNELETIDTRIDVSGAVNGWPIPSILIPSTLNSYCTSGHCFSEITYCPGTAPPSLLSCPSKAVRNEWKEILDGKWPKTKLSNVQFGWMMSNHIPELAFCGLDPDASNPLDDGPNNWRTVCLYYISLRYATQHFNGGPFLAYKTVIAPEDSLLKEENIKVKTENWHDFYQAHPIGVMNVGKHKASLMQAMSFFRMNPVVEMVKNPSNLVALGSWPVEKRQLLSVFGVQTYAKDWPNVVFKNVVLAFKTFEISELSSSKDIEFAIMRTLDALRIETLDNGTIPTDEINLDKPLSDMERYNPGYGSPDGALINHTKVQELYKMWIANTNGVFSDAYDLSLRWDVSGYKNNEYLQFISDNMIWTLKSDGWWGQVKTAAAHLFKHKTDREVLIELQWKAYLRWVEANVNHRKARPNDYIPVDDPITTPDHQYVRTKLGARIDNVQPDMGILIQPGDERPRWFSFVGLWTVLFGDEFYYWLKNIFTDVFKTMLKAFEFISKVIKETVIAGWPILLLGGALLIGGVAATHALERQIDKT